MGEEEGVVDGAILSRAIGERADRTLLDRAVGVNRTSAWRFRANKQVMASNNDAGDGDMAVGQGCGQGCVLPNMASRKPSRSCRSQCGRRPHSRAH